MKKKLLAIPAAGLLLLGGLYFASGNLLQGKFSVSPTPSASLCGATSTVFDARSGDDSTDFMNMLNSASTSTCKYSISANAYPVDGSTPMNTNFECSNSDLEILYDTSSNDYQFECNQDHGDFKQSIRANLTPESDGSFTLGANMDFKTDDSTITHVLNPDTVTITRLKK